MPELQRGELSGTVLQLKALGVDNVMAFDYLAPPPAEAMVKAAELLFALGAIDDQSRCCPRSPAAPVHHQPAPLLLFLRPQLSLAFARQLHLRLAVAFRSGCKRALA